MKKILLLFFFALWGLGCEKWELPDFQTIENETNQVPEPEPQPEPEPEPLLNMITIPGGTFQMGSNNAGTSEKPVHTVTVSTFQMSKTEVTVKQFREFINDTDYKPVSETGGGSYFYNGAKDQWEIHTNVTWKNDASGLNLANETHPVLHISYNDALEFCSWLSKKEGKRYRLPTEAEWEYAAGGGSSHFMYSWGNGSPPHQVSNLADVTFAEAFSVTQSGSNIFLNYYDNFIYTAPVASFSPNPFGLYDMTGNVKEWCQDWLDWEYYSKSPVLNPKGPASPSGDNYKVIRGGYWYAKPFATSNYTRLGAKVDFRSHHLGLRVVAEVN